MSSDRSDEHEFNVIPVNCLETRAGYENAFNLSIYTFATCRFVTGCCYDNRLLAPVLCIPLV